MEGSQNNIPNSQPISKNVPEEANIYEDEINLIDYFWVLWKRKWFIFLASVVPALVIGLAAFRSPRDYKITFTYNMGLGEKAFKVLEDTFYSTENLEKLAQKLQAGGFNGYAENIVGAGTAEGLRGFVSFEISPSYFEAIEYSKARNLGELQKFQEARGTLLVMRVVAKPEENIRKISSVCRKNFEQIIPLYSEREELNNKIINLKEGMAAIEEARYTLNLQLERKKSTLEKLKNSGSEGLSRLPSDIVLQFNIEPSKAKDPNELQKFNNVGGNSAYLPLLYQIQAAETQIINLEESIRANQEKYNYYKGLLSLNEGLFGQVRDKISSYYTTQQFHAFLTKIVKDYEEKELIDYLNAYIKRVENIISANIPVIEKPKVYPIPRGTVKKTAVVFAVALMISVFVAFLLEGFKKSQART